jgi:hypothetical protein
MTLDDGDKATEERRTGRKEGVSFFVGQWFNLSRWFYDPPVRSGVWMLSHDCSDLKKLSFKKKK